MPPATIKTEADYEMALAEIAPYFDNVPKPDTPEAHRFDELSGLIAQYEAATMMRGTN